MKYYKRWNRIWILVVDNIPAYLQALDYFPKAHIHTARDRYNHNCFIKLIYSSVRNNLNAMQDSYDHAIKTTDESYTSRTFAELQYYTLVIAACN